MLLYSTFTSKIFSDFWSKDSVVSVFVVYKTKTEIWNTLELNRSTLKLIIFLHILLWIEKFTSQDELNRSTLELIIFTHFSLNLKNSHPKMKLTRNRYELFEWFYLRDWAVEVGLISVVLLYWRMNTPYPLLTASPTGQSRGGNIKFCFDHIPKVPGMRTFVGEQ